MTVEDHTDVRGLVGELLSGLREISEVREVPQGVSGLREDRRFQAACAAMQGLVACGAAEAGGIDTSADTEPASSVADWIARESVFLADCLLKRLEAP